MDVICQFGGWAVRSGRGGERVQIGFSAYLVGKKGGFFSIICDRDRASTVTRLDMHSRVAVEGKS
tara:strand:- start:468 stop:662 length:195 start_codon:yes stop_codon:yes gene_type:complete